VDGSRSCQDDGIDDMVSKIYNLVKGADYVKAVKPLTWFEALDALVATNKSSLSLEEASSVARANGVAEDSLILFFSFLNDMGVVLWLDETGLREVIILDIIIFCRTLHSYILQPHI